jgi:hypothetical protein
MRPSHSHRKRQRLRQDGMDSTGSAWPRLGITLSSTPSAGVCEVMGCRARTRVRLSEHAAELPHLSSLRQTRAKDVHCGHNCPHSLLMRGQRGTVTGDELAQQDIATTQRLHGLKAFQKRRPAITDLKPREQPSRSRMAT